MQARETSEGSAADILRGRQIHAAEQNVEKALYGYLLTAPLTTLIFIRSWGGLFLAWDVAVAVICVVRLGVARRVTRHPPAPLRAAEARRYILWSMVTSTIFLSAPLWVQVRTEGFTFAYMLALCLGTFWCGCFAHAPLMASAVSFSLTPMALIGLFSWQAGFDADRIGLMALFACGTATALHVTRQTSHLFARSALQQLELERNGADLSRQAEVIGLVLKEHEDQSSDWLWQTDRELRIESPSSRFCEAVGRPAPLLGGAMLEDVFRSLGAGHEGLDAMVAHIAARQSFRDLVLPLQLDGQPRWWAASGRPMLDAQGAFCGYRGVMADITVAKLAETRIVHLAHHDALTDLPNRAYFCERLLSDLGSLGEEGLAVISIDLDGFKPVNDRYGHPVGDALLTMLAERLRAMASNQDLMARFGGDEFAVRTLRGEPAEVEALCRRLIAALSEPVTLGDSVITVGASIGVAFAPLDGASVEELLKNADSALYRAKGDGRGTFRFFSADMDQQLQKRQQLVHDLRMALTRQEFSLHYQPFVNAETGQVTGCEALIRWQHPERGLVSPAEFIPVAEECGIIVPIGAWVIEEACRQAATWSAELRVSVNISPVQFRDNDLPERILSALHRSGLSPRRLEIEVTETALMANSDAALSILRRIRALGIRVALDDFGTGYSSLGYLCRFPFDKIKIDRSFVNELDTRHDSQVIVQAIRDLARGLDMTITAEGVETAAQADRLRLTGCHELQGYLYSRPRALEDLGPLLTRRFAA